MKKLSTIIILIGILVGCTNSYDNVITNVSIKKPTYITIATEEQIIQSQNLHTEINDLAKSESINDKKRLEEIAKELTSLENKRYSIEDPVIIKNLIEEINNANE